MLFWSNNPYAAERVEAHGEPLSRHALLALGIEARAQFRAYHPEPTTPA